MMSRTVYSFLGINKNINTSQNSNKINFVDVIVILKKNKRILYQWVMDSFKD